MELRIYHLYPDLLNLYGDRGNMTALKKRCEWRGINAHLIEFTRDSEPDFENADIVFIGGGSDREQEILYKHLIKYRNTLKALIEDGLTILAICGGYQLLGDYYLDASRNKVDGLKILEFYTRSEKGRLIGNTAIESQLPIEPKTLVGFENHGGRTYHPYNPLGKVLKGYGNNGKDHKEGLVYKNIIGTYFHGPFLPKNPHITDYIITNALERKYQKKITLNQLNDFIEIEAHNSVKKRILKSGK